MLAKTHFQMLCIYSVFSTTMYGQSYELDKQSEQNPFEVLSAQPKAGNYLYPVIKLKDSMEDLIQKVPQSMYHQSLAVAYNNLGSYEDALREWDVQPIQTIQHDDIKSFDDYYPVNAIEALSGLVKEERIVMINEAHHLSRHRFFLKQALESFYDVGFRKLAIEAININAMEDLIKNGYPILSTGAYVVEPMFGQLIREAVTIGFEIIAYDVAESDMNKRDSLQADAIIRCLNADLDSKVIVYTGFGHIREKTKNNWVTMAQAIKIQTGINPFTIDQVQLTEKSETDYQNAYYNKIIANYERLDSFILINEHMSPWVIPEDEGTYDMQIIHPKTIYKFGRPGWLMQNQSYHKRKIYQHQSEEDRLLQAYLYKELKDYGYDHLIPFDQTVIKAGENHGFLFLNQGCYKLRTIMINGKIESECYMEVD